MQQNATKHPSLQEARTRDAQAVRQLPGCHIGLQLLLHGGDTSNKRAGQLHASWPPPKPHTPLIL